MSDYISREAAINAVFEAYADGRSAYIALEAIPAADVRPVVRGKWKDVEVTDVAGKTSLPLTSIVSMRCSDCSRYHNEVYFYGCATENIHYCPYCGADMREEQT